VPLLAPGAMLHVPEQHSVLLRPKQGAPLGPHAQLPLAAPGAMLHVPEQHSAFVEQLFSAISQVHVASSPQNPKQHWVSVVQAPPIETQTHVLPEQLPEQQLAPTVQAPPLMVQTHVPPEHIPEQH
jgi:hypothetical protein